MALKKDEDSKTLGAIKHILKQVPQDGLLLAYTSLCRPILEYTNTVWDPTLAKEVESLKTLQHRAVPFIARLESLKLRRKNHRLSLLMKIWQNEEQHSTLPNRQKVTTRSAAHGKMMTFVYTASHVYHGSYLPKTIKDTGGNTDYQTLTDHRN